MNKLLRSFATLLSGFCLVFSAGASAIVIDFDHDAGGAPLSAPDTFAATTPLTNLYASLGVHFSGVAGNSGSILNAGSGFGVAPRSGPNFLAFNDISTGAGEAITLDIAATEVSIWVAGGSSGSNVFTMEVFDAGNILLGSHTISAGSFALLDVAANGITKAVITVRGDCCFVMDDLTIAQQVPAPATPVLIVLGLVGLGLFRRRMAL